MAIAEELRDSFFHKVNILELRQQLKDLLNENATSLPDGLFDFLEKDIANDHRAILLELENEQGDFFTFDEIHRLGPLIGSSLGELLEQNENGDKVITVFDRDRHGSMYQGARYHQTREGGSIHTDNVNIPEPWDYLYLSCLAPGEVGGENILVDGSQVHAYIKANFPNALKTLEEDFIWEMRGVSEALYRAPIVTYNQKGEPLFRHLRPYMESAHLKANEPLSSEQLYAIDLLDAVTNSSDFQIRYRLKKGDILFTKDAQVLHGRTCFSDALEAVSLEDYNLGKGKILKRTMERLWIRK